MIYLLVGHRGVGKTSLLQRIKKYKPDANVICLDEQIEKKYGAISQIFKDKGEAAFREIEKSIFLELMPSLEKSASDSYISLGAGFQGSIPKNTRVLWIRRDIDSSQQLFLDRPTLNKDKNNLEFPEELFRSRTVHYSSICNDELTLPEGVYDFLEEEKKYFNQNIREVGGTLTLLPEFIDKETFSSWIKERDLWGLKSFELRNDLLTSIQIEKVIAQKLKTPLLFSFRHTNNFFVDEAFALQCDTRDWDATLGNIPESLKANSFLSFHSEKSDFYSDFEKIKKKSLPIKWAPIVHSWTDLEIGHQWAMAQPQERSFLPRSQDGRWSWYRRVTKNKMMLHFFREGRGSAIDQPNLLEWMFTDEWAKNNAAVIGAPISHSWSPVFHKAFFAELKMNMFSVHITESEMNAEVMTFLTRLGFVAFAITSPLKSWAQKWTNAKSSINTLVQCADTKNWKSYSTDMVGFESLLSKANIDLSTLRVAIWGAGSMAEEIKKKYPSASIYSARTGSCISSTEVEKQTPQVLVWASGDVGIDSLKAQYGDWKPDFLIDLNYRQDSPAISFAHKWGARYVSGAEMFFAQAREQQKIWKKELKT